MTMTLSPCLSTWFPLLERSGVPVPRTVIVTAEGGLALEEPDPAVLTKLVADLRAAATSVGVPCFLRTGHGSGKHEWSRTCHVTDLDQIKQHVLNLVEWSEMVDFLGLPTDVWVVREMLALESSFTAFRGLPITRERRCFIEGGRMRCVHPYWPREAVASGNPSADDWEARLTHLNGIFAAEYGALKALSERVAALFDGAWSLDWAKTVDGRWIAIDIAPAARSWHWPGCPMNPAKDI